MQIKNHLKQDKKVYVLFLVSFFFATHAYLPLYINSTFLAGFVSEDRVGIIFSIGSFLSILGLIFIPKILKRFGNLKTTVSIMILEGLFLLGFTALPSIYFVVPFFIMILLLQRILFYNFDMFVETNSSEEKVGIIRSMYLTVMSFALVICPILAGIIMREGEYWRVYLIALLLLVPTIVLLIFNFRKAENPQYDTLSFKSISEVVRNDAFQRVFASQFLLRIFFAWMVIYTPMYLHNVIGFSWSEIGAITTIALLPFVIFELPLEILSEKKIEKKWIMSLGFLIIALSVASMSLITEAYFVLWSAILFMTRTGASMIEVTSEVYFFQKITAANTDIVSLFRAIGPTAWVLAPVVATISLFFVDLRWTFLILAIILLFGLSYSLNLKTERS